MQLKIGKNNGIKRIHSLSGVLGSKAVCVFVSMKPTESLLSSEIHGVSGTTGFMFALGGGGDVE